MKKIKYEKPVSFDAGEIASIKGAGCTTGSTAGGDCNPGSFAAGGACSIGNNPTYIPYCDNVGNVAFGNCYPFGTTAGQSCHAGTAPGW